MHVVGVAGWSGSGKTTLVEALVRLLSAQGSKVSVIKHAHHRFDIDRPGKDSWRHREAGAFEVLAASDQLIALQRKLPQPREVPVEELLDWLDPSADWVLIDGYKQAALPKIEVWRAATQRAPLYPTDDNVLAVLTDSPGALAVTPAPRPVLDLNDVAAIAQWLQRHRTQFIR